eukprot:CAMPEP_0176385924 /NCGR_PEP_ID=MMETSP0126-20121128/35526_1 /TAXON_ID=141414 ORGANISM="Strombidinopsis acuminatum, Strain SPMC142" /NCGR_SAMPLE_ID=MMETSP0126 /ASSEMBLY_ACC=CAM_ASM_000229 /LENGTH=100 /DNA_ID=CAMNT_0017752551 /DNA_START=1948 /DNA_END=2250 /DNA_ORIENTATION=-
MTVKEAESDLDFLGATAVEDMLQDEVKKCVDDFKDADIKVWMLTGDKGETAYQIGLSTGIISSESNSVWLTEEKVASYAIKTKESFELLIDGTALSKMVA